MARRFRNEDAFILRYGGGRNTRASEDQIDPLECAEGENFLLDPGNSEFRPREPVDLLGTVPNAAEIRGFVTLRKTDGSVSMLVQAGANVYEWDGTSFALIGTVDANAKLRGRREAFWPLADKVIIADINLADEIHTWNGTTLTQETLLQSDGSTSFGPLRAKYVLVENEVALYANVHDNGTNFPHLIVGSEQGDFLVVDTGNRPSSSLSASDPWFLPMPQLKPINGIAKGFGVVGISQELGAFEKLTGSDARDFSIKELHDLSGAVGVEAVASIPNDIAYGAPGHIESLQATEQFGDVALDDLSFAIQDDIEEFNDWTIVYNQRLRRLYCFPVGSSEVHVLFTDFIGQNISGWSKYTTVSAFSFQPTAVMSCFDPVDGLEYVFMGDSNGNLYRMEGTGGAGDIGAHPIVSFRESILTGPPVDAKSFDGSGWIQYRKNAAVTAKMTWRFAGEHVSDKQIDVELPGVSYGTTYGGSVYYGGNIYYGAVNESRLVRSTFGLNHFANQWQVRTEVEDTDSFSIAEVGYRYEFAG